VRYYTDIGLLKVVAETPGGYRLYDQAEATRRVEAVRQAKGEQPSLREAMAMLEGGQVSAA
jgi:DNA-binding transcriptional MerR regulator